MYRVHLEEFEGPLDLLLYFIRRDELDVFDIPIARIADEYLAYVRLMEAVDLDSVGDFLYMAAVLINIKARMLLPVQEHDEEGEPIDPRRELVERLLEYIRFKEASQRLSDLHDRRMDQFTRPASTQERQELGETVVHVEASLFDLISALRRVLTEPSTPPHHAIVREEYAMEDQQAFVREKLAGIDRLSFAALVGGRSRAFIIATFLAVLELARLGVVALVVPATPTDFFVVRRPDPTPAIGVHGSETNGAGNV